MHINLFFSFLHAHFKLVLFILQPINVVSRSVETLLDLPDFKFHDVVLNQNLLFLLLDLC
jgi:hypothetical protein